MRRVEFCICDRCGAEYRRCYAAQVYCTIQCAGAARRDGARAPFREKIRARLEAAKLLGLPLKYTTTAEAVGTYPGMVRAIVAELEG